MAVSGGVAAGAIVAPSLDLAIGVKLALVLALVMVPIAIADLALFKVHRRESTGLKTPEQSLNEQDLARVLVKCAGFYGTLLCIACLYWAFPLYDSEYYKPFFELLAIGAPPILICAPFFFWFVDRRMVAPRDGYWHAGLLFLAKWRHVDLGELRIHALGWLIKAFFLPLMIGELAVAMRWLGRHPVEDAFSHIVGAVSWVAQLSLYVDLAFVATGYVVTLRLLDSHIRSVNPFVLGWGVALICYQPFWSVISSAYLQYGDNIGWQDWTKGNQVLMYAWGVTIIVVKLLWAWSTVVFGLRFSNLTHRGIITGGPFRLTKHPSYICKNLSWWLISVPFISQQGPLEALNHCLLLLGVNAIYFARARTEERHLSSDPAYVAYALWIREHGVFRWIDHVIPWLAYRPPAAAEQASMKDADKPRVALAE